MSTDIVRKIKWLLLFVGDVLILYGALWVTLRTRYDTYAFYGRWEEHLIPFSIVFLAWLLIFYILGLYDLNSAKNTYDFYTTLTKAAAVCAVTGFSFFYLIPYFGIAPKTNLLLAILFSFTGIVIWRRVYNDVVKYPVLARNLLAVGKGPYSEELMKKISANPQLGYNVLGVVDPDSLQFKEMSANNQIHTIVSSVDLRQHPEFARTLYGFLPQLHLRDLPSFYEDISGKIPISQIDEIWFLANLKEGQRALYELVKRVIDIATGAILFAVMLALYPFVAFAIKFESKGPVFYTQTRVGKNSKHFKLIKFRSMIEIAEADGAQWSGKNDPRVTRVGKVLRKTLIDELPQSINILKGDMSLIGPRPERPEFISKLEQEIPYYQIRHLVKPGLSGWAQVRFRYGSSNKDAREKLQYDLYYIKNRSVFLDIKIALKTIDILLKGGTQ